MIFYKAFATEEKPLITWNTWAHSIDELIDLGADDDPLILPAELVPDFVYGVCPLKIVAGELVERTEGEMLGFQTEYETYRKLKDNTLLVDLLKTETFTYDSLEFPMDEASRLFYSAFERTRGNQKLMTATGVLYDLYDTATNLDDFLAAFYSKLKLTMQPDV